MALPVTPIKRISPGAPATSDTLNEPLIDIQENLVYLENEKERIKAKVNGFIGAPDEALDTLSEIVTSLGNNPNLAATLEHVKPHVIVGAAGTPEVTHTETNFVTAVNSSGGTLNKILFLSGITFTANREITESVKLMMASPETYIDIGATETIFSGEVDGELSINGSGTITISGLARGLKIDTQGNPTVNFATSGGTGAIFVNGELRIAGESFVLPQILEDNSNRIATSAFIKKSAIDNLTDTSTNRPLSANMGRELQNTKAPIDNPAFTGIPTAPTATSSENPTQIATTAFVNDIYSAIDNKLSIQATPGNRIPTLSEVEKLHTIPALNGNSPCFLRKIQASIPEDFDDFGYSVAISGNRIVVGAYLKNTTADEAGSAYIFDSNGKFKKKIQAPDDDDEAGDKFGLSVAISGNRIVVGAPFDDTAASNAGSAYIYDSNGEFLHKIQAFLPETGDYFGHSVAVSGDRIVVGAPNEDTSAENAGSVYIFDSNGNPQKKIQADVPGINDNFGCAVAVSGNRIVVGASGEDTTAFDAGSAYIYDSDGTFLHMIQAVDPKPGDHFGCAVAISGNRIVVGAENKATPESYSGAIYIYNTSGNPIKEIFGSERKGHFGKSVAISGNRIVVGAYLEDKAASDAGLAYIYDSNGKFKNRIQASDPETDDRFGSSVAISGDRIVVGAPNESTTALSTGSVYIYHNVTNNIMDIVQAWVGKD